MSDSYEIDQESLSIAITFLDQFLSTKLPNYDFSPGTANRDIAINSIALVFSLLRQEISSVKSDLTLTKLKDKTDESSKEMVDALLSTYFITRHTGEYALGTATLYFSSNTAVNIVVTDSNTFIKDNVEFKLNANAKSISASDLKQNTDNFGKVYYTATLPLIAKEKGTAGKISTGLFNSWDVSSPYLYAIEALEAFTTGEDSESSASLIARSEKALTIRNLVTQKAIYTVLMDKYSFIKNVISVGMNDPEMQRDLLTVTVGSTPIKIHRGSMIDIYCQLPIVFKNELNTQVTDEVPGTVYKAVKMPAVPIYKIRSVINVDSNNSSVPYTVAVTDPTLFLSNKQGLYLQFDAAMANKNVKITYDYISNLDEVQSFVASKVERTVVSDSLVKAPFALYLSFEMSVYASVDIDEESMLKTIQDVVHGTAIGTPLYVATLVEKVVTAYGMLVQLPLTVTGSVLLSNGETMTFSFQDKVSLPEKYLKTTTTPVKYLPFFEGDTNPNNYETGLMADLQISNHNTRIVMETSDSKIRRI